MSSLEKREAVRFSNPQAREFPGSELTLAQVRRLPKHLRSVRFPLGAIAEGDSWDAVLNAHMHPAEGVSCHRNRPLGGIVGAGVS